MADRRERRPATRERRPRWGLWTLGFLAVALISILTSGGDYTLLTGAGLVVGFAGAAYCSYHGLKGFTWIPR